MRSYLSVFLVMTGLGLTLFVLRVCQHDGQGCESVGPLNNGYGVALALEGRSLDEQIAGHRHFAALLKETLTEVERGHIDLFGASIAIQAAATEFYPRYLECLIYAEEGSTDLENVARNVIRQFRELNTTPEKQGQLTGLVHRLEQELHAIVFSPSSRGPSAKAQEGRHTVPQVQAHLGS